MMEGRVIFEFQSETQFLRGQSSRTQARAELFEQAIQQEGKRLEQHDGMLQFDGFFKNQRRFYGDQSARGGAPRQLLQTQTFLPETLAERNFRQRGQGAQVTDAPTGECFQQTIGGFFLISIETIFFQMVREQHFQQQWAQSRCFLAWRDHRHAVKTASGERGCVGIGSDGDVGGESEGGSAVGDGTGNFRQ